MTPLQFLFQPFRLHLQLRGFALFLLLWSAAIPLASAEHMPGDTTLTATICANETYEFDGQALNQTGEYTATYIASDGSDSTVTLQLTVLPLLSETLEVSICQGESYPFAGLILTDSGEYEAVLTGSNGCDSTVTLQLTVLPLLSETLEATICQGESYPFAGLLLTTSGIYEEVFTGSNGCDSTVTLNLTVLPNSFTKLTAGICTGSTYVFQNDTLSESGTYLAILTAENGCDSLVELSLSVVDFFAVPVNAVICNGETYFFGGEFLNTEGIYVDSLTAIGGCDSIITLNLHILPMQMISLNVAICEGAQYVFEGDTLTNAGEYIYVGADTNGCDSVTVLKLETVSFFETALEATICENDTYLFGGELLAAEGVYTDTLTAVGGCDSILTLTLHVLPNASGSESATICDGESFEYQGEVLTQPGDYIFTFPAANGCDSIVTLTLNVLEAPNTVLEAVICNGATYIFYGEQLTESGVYEAVFQAENGCDSTVSLLLTVLPELVTDIQAAVCAGDNYEFNGELFNQAGNYTFVFVSELGCDSTVNLTLSVLPVQQLTLNTSICAGDTYQFDGVDIADAGIYTAVYTGINGCDSTVTLNLSVVPLLSSTVEASICAGSSYAFNGLSLTDAGTYTATVNGSNGCDSTVTLILSVLPTYITPIEATICEGDSYSFYGQLLTEAGNYEFNLTAENGCDSTISITLTVLPLTYSAMEVQICQGEIYEYNGDSLSTTGTYYFAFDGSNGCDSIMIIYLSVQPVYTTIQNLSLCEGTPYNFNGITLTTEGSYIAEFTSIYGCDSSVVLNLSYVNTFETNLQASICPGSTYIFDQDTLSEAGVYELVYVSVGGCDSTVILNLSILPTSSSTSQAEICAGGSFNFNGQILTESGEYTALLTGANGCDSTATLTLTVLPVQTTTVDASTCINEGYPFGGELLVESGVYTNILQGSNGCDSIVTLNLTVYPVAATNLEAEICSGESYTFNGLSLTEPGTYSSVLATSQGCDSIVTLVLTVLPTASGSVTASTCNGEAYTFNGQFFNQSGVYTVVLSGAAANGCDSLAVLNLTVFQPILPIIVEAVICAGDTFSFNGQNFTEAGEYTFQYTTPAGCDSTIILGLAVSPTNETTIQAQICAGESYEFNGNSYTDEGVYTFHLQNQFGCDSTVSLVLSVEAPLPVNVTLQNGTLSAAAFANGYQWINCATNQAVAGANADTFTPTVSGQYAVIVTSPNGCTNVSNCVNVTISGTKELLDNDAWRVFPNPANSYTVVQFSAATEADFVLELMDAAGRTLNHLVVPAGATELRLNLDMYPGGLYLVRVAGANGASAKVISKNH